MDQGKGISKKRLSARIICSSEEVQDQVCVRERVKKGSK